jgi:hypothetical protein
LRDDKLIKRRSDGREATTPDFAPPRTMLGSVNLAVLERP